MKIYEGYVLVSELTHKANKSDAWLHTLANVEIDYIQGVAVVKTSTVPKKYQHLVKECQDMRNYYPFSSFSKEIVRESSYMAVLANQRAKANKPPFETLKIRGHRLLKLSEEFIELAQQGLNVYKLGQSDKEEDFKKVIVMQGMKIGFY